MRTERSDLHATPSGAAEPWDARANDGAEATFHARVDELCAQGRRLLRSDPARQRAIAEEAFELACQPEPGSGEPYPEGMAAALSLSAQCSLFEGSWQEALGQTSQALALLVDSPPGLTLAYLHEVAGWAHFYLGDYVEATSHIMTSLRVAQGIGDRSSEAYALERLASVQGSTDDLDVALATHRRALALHRDLGDRFGEALALNNMSYALMDLGRFDEARQSVEEALHFAEEANWPYLIMGALDTLSELHIRLGHLDEAERHCLRNLELAQAHKSVADEINAQLALARIGLARHRWDAAAHCANRAVDLAARQGQLVEQYRAEELLSQIEEGRGDDRKALAHFREYHRLRQAQLSGDAESRLANLRIEHEVQTARKDAEIARLRSIALEKEVDQWRIAHAQLEAQASLDPLTCLYNRRHLELLGESLSHALAEQRCASLVMIDVDRFKHVNDAHGHAAGDAVLISVAQRLGRNSRETDTPCRYGGDEFLMLLLDRDSGDAAVVAERLREAIANARVAWNGSQIAITISAGVAAVPAGAHATLDDLIERADAALYKAKLSGRDRVIVG